MRIQAQTERLDAPSELRKQRRLIARFKTIQTQRAGSGRGSQVSESTIAMPKRVSIGVVTSDKMAKTRRVEIPAAGAASEVRQDLAPQDRVPRARRSRRVPVGDTVEIRESRPRSQDQAVGAGARGGQEPAGRHCGHAGRASRGEEETEARKELGKA